ncbi:GH36-type glycosyl hydrolase domain-containing protein [Ruminiclostridium hungatei]|nr:cellobiose phosphorylase [Ruminiclostridium hungatei]
MNFFINNEQDGIKMSTGWNFTDQMGTFRMEAPHRNSHLYFPLANEAGMMSAVTPALHGDIKTGQNTFFSTPVSADDLHNTKSNRNFWIYIEGKGAWSAAGASALQHSELFNKDTEEKVTLRAGFLWHKVIRENERLGVKAEITSFVPANQYRVELMKVAVSNTGAAEIRVTPTAAIPVYARSAESLRDHRNVTSLLHRVYVVKEGIEVQPAMTFDERGHKVNRISYNVYGTDDAGKLPLGAFPVAEEYMGEGGSLEWPETIAANRREFCLPGQEIEGYEAIGALRFDDCRLLPGESKSYIIAMSVTEDRNTDKSGILGFLNMAGFEALLKKTQEYWEEKLGRISFKSSDDKFDGWMKWVSLQPILRRIYGCSFLPHHDYGKGGRGWRDLWQDCLALLLMETDTVRAQLWNNYGGVRLDGTNATIIGKEPGEFIADRNNISRVWSDHGAWPFFTTLLYLNQSGDMDFLFEKQAYFKDRLIARSTGIDEDWTAGYGNRQKCDNGEVYTGTILEHILLQNLTAFFNVGEHNNIRMENADWNDALDMAAQKGETVAFTAFYAGNLLELGKLLKKVREERGRDRIEVAAEIAVLLDTLSQSISYDSPAEKQELLSRYYKTCRHNISGQKVLLDTARVSEDLNTKGRWLSQHIADNELVKTPEGLEWFNGYYDNRGLQVEGVRPEGVRMTLTGQVFPIMMGIASKHQTGSTIKAVDRYLFDRKLGSYRLNNNFNELKLDLGRCFGFAFGHKENGAVFSHMTIMYAFALYRQDFVQEGYQVLKSLYNISTDFDRARIYPGIPEYINERGRGMYHYLTGSASWLMLLMLTEVYGVGGNAGKLYIRPKLKAGQFDGTGTASVKTVFADRTVRLVYRNRQHLDYGEYSVKSITLDGLRLDLDLDPCQAEIDRAAVLKLDRNMEHLIEVELGAKKP